MNPFHYSFNVLDLASTRRFYRELLGCAEGRSAATWVDFDFFGNQISAHLGEPARTADTGQVDGLAVPMPHFGAVIGWEELQALARRLEAAAVPFVLSPRVRYPGQPAEQVVFFVRDPSGNALEMKAFKDPRHVFTP